MTDKKNINNQKGFSGFDSLLSDVSSKKQKENHKPTNTHTKEKQKKRKEEGGVRKENNSSSKKAPQRPVFILIGAILLISILIITNYGQKHSPSHVTSNSEGVNFYNHFNDNEQPKVQPQSHANSPHINVPVESNLDTQGVCEVQELLMRQGIFSTKVDGLMGPNTNKAILNFSSNHGIQYAGTLTKRILEKIRHIVDKSKSVFSPSANLRNPSNGYVFSSIGEAVAPLKIKTASGSNYYVKVVDAFSKQIIKSFFIRAGLTVNTKVPLGTYEIRYASGKQWFSQRCLFGRKTRYNKAAKTFTFNIEENRVSGYSIELIKQARGNLHTTQLSHKSF